MWAFWPFLLKWDTSDLLGKYFFLKHGILSEGQKIVLLWWWWYCTLCCWVSHHHQAGKGARWSWVCLFASMPRRVGHSGACDSAEPWWGAWTWGCPWHPSLGPWSPQRQSPHLIPQGWKLAEGQGVPPGTVHPTWPSAAPSPTTSSAPAPLGSSAEKKSFFVSLTGGKLLDVKVRKDQKQKYY